MSEAGTPTSRPSVKPTVPRSLRVGSFLLSVLLMFLFVWLLGFVLDDLDDLPGPQWNEVLARHEDPALRTRAGQLLAAIGDIDRQVARQSELQGELRASMGNARDAMSQFLSLQRSSLDQGIQTTDADRQILIQAQQRFFEAQDRFEVANAEIAASNEARHTLREEQRTVQEQLEAQERPARTEYDALYREHRWRVAAYKLAFIVPIFLLAAWLFSRNRTSPFRSIYLALLAATFWKLGQVMFEHFPREYFKYIAITAAIAIVLGFLLWMLRKAARPGRDLLLTRYREAYRAHVCPVCAYPIARGPLRFAVWTRKGPRPASGDHGASDDGEGAPYACPSCGTSLFAPCTSCQSMRHALLPFCEHCGDERSDAVVPAEA